jgi:hypothetical protein
MGSAIRKEKRAASFLFTPRNNPADIVAPDLEIPGRREKIWKIPIQIASPLDKSAIDLIRRPSFSAKKSVPPVMSKNMETHCGLSITSSTRDLSNNPMNIAGRAETKISHVSRISGFDRSSRFLRPDRTALTKDAMSFQK